MPTTLEQLQTALKNLCDAEKTVTKDLNEISLLDDQELYNENANKRNRLNHQKRMDLMHIHTMNIN